MGSSDRAPGAAPSLPPATRLLLAARLGGVVGVEALVERTGLPSDEVAALASSLAEEGLLRVAGSSWSLTPSGRARGEDDLRAALARAGALDEVRAAYAALLARNDELLDLATSWQLRPTSGSPVVNDHTDADHDRAVLERLAALHEGARTALAAIAAVDGFEGYEARLSIALARALAGEVDYVARPTVDSYHQVWFELHEHLLAALGIERSTEGQET